MDVFFQSANEIPRFHSAIAEIASCFVYALLLKRRMTGAQLFFATLGATIVQIVFMVATGNVPILFWLPCMITAFGSMYFYMLCILKLSPAGVLYYCLQAFVLAEFVASFEWQIAFALRKVFGKNLWGARVIPLFFIPLVIMTVVFVAAYFLLKTHFYYDFYRTPSRKEVFTAFSILVFVFAFSNLKFAIPEFGLSVEDTALFRTLITLLGVAVLFAIQSRINELDAERELAYMNNMLQTQYNKYRSYQDTINLVNIKYHDLKHLIEGLKANITTEEKNEWISRMEKELEEYEPAVQTGDSVLDTMIDSKMSVCRNNNIKLTVVADGELISFMHVNDICTIFGNALDNSIESVIQVEDPDRRMIHLTLAGKKQFVIISVENYCAADVVIGDELPNSTKRDKRSHGFGLKSIRQTVEKYGGSMNITSRDRWFRLQILIPVR